MVDDVATSADSLRADVASASLVLDRTVDEGVGRVTVDGAIDASTVTDLRDIVLGLLAEDANSLVLDCRGLTFIDSMGLSVLVEAHEAAALKLGTVRIENAPPLLVRLLELTGLEAVLDVSTRE